jgi:DNA-binding SARP family transcriptional activator/transcriptional regulator with XRE-family HTH domain
MRHSHDDPAPPFGSLVRMYRREAGLTQRELAAKTGLSVATLRDFEQFRRRWPRPNSLAALASAFELDADQAARLTQAAVLPRQRTTDALLASRVPLGDADAATPGHSPGPGAGLWLAVLGPLDAWRDGVPLSLGPPARRAVLTLLALAPGTLVRRDVIIGSLWGAAPPRTGVDLIQAHVSRIRKLIAPGQAQGRHRTIDSVRGAYRLSLSAQEMDLLTFRELAARAAAAQAAGEDTVAADCYEQATALCRGEPFADVEMLSGYPGITALRQELTDVLLRYAEVAGALGQHYRVLPRLQALADTEPLNESAHARLMIALAGSGRQADAIGVYEELRGRLDRELGLYPGNELAEAYLRVLRQDIHAGSLDRVRTRPSAPAVAMYLIPRQLPAAPRCLVGRSAELAALSALTERDLSGTSGVGIVALTGMAGIGKTALAMHWAHQVAGRFPDGQLFVNLRGSDPSGAPVMPTSAVCGFLVALGVPPARIPPDTDGQAALYRSLLTDRRMLIVLDNALQAEQVRPLLPGSPGCLVLVTSRNRLTGLAAAEGAHLMTPRMLTEAESRELLAWGLGADRAAAEQPAVSELIMLCGRLPLALCDVAARATARPGLPLAALVAEMRDGRRRLDALETGEPATSVRMVFSWSRTKLGSRASRMFRLLGMYPGPDIGRSAAASLTALPPAQAFLALAELCDEHLLTEYAPGRYTWHDLLRSYAIEEARTRESETCQQAATRRVLDHYLHAASVASGFLCTWHEAVTWPAPQPGVTPEEIQGAAQAAQWFENEQHVLLNLISQAAEGGYAPYAWELPWVAGWYYRSPACLMRLAAAQESAAVVAASLDDLAGQAIARQHLGWLRFLLGDIGSASDHLDEAIALARRIRDGRLFALAGLSRAHVLQTQGRIPEAMIQARQALRIYQAAWDPCGEVGAWYMIGWHLAQFGDREQAARSGGGPLMTGASLGLSPGAVTD